MVEEVNPDVILLQEIKTKERVKPIIQSDKYGQVFAKDDKESWILFRKEKFTCVSDFCNRITSGFTSSTTFGTRRFLGSASPGPLMFHNKTRILRGGGGGSKK